MIAAGIGSNQVRIQQVFSLEITTKSITPTWTNLTRHNGFVLGLRQFLLRQPRNVTHLKLSGQVKNRLVTLPRLSLKL